MRKQLKHFRLQHMNVLRNDFFSYRISYFAFVFVVLLVWSQQHLHIYNNKLCNLTKKRIITDWRIVSKFTKRKIVFVSMKKTQEVRSSLRLYHIFGCSAPKLLSPKLTWFGIKVSMFRTYCLHAALFKDDNLKILEINSRFSWLSILEISAHNNPISLSCQSGFYLFFKVVQCSHSKHHHASI